MLKFQNKLNIKDLRIKESSTPNIRLVGIHDNLAFAKRNSWAIQINNAVKFFNSSSARQLNVPK